MNHVPFVESTFKGMGMGWLLDALTLQKNAGGMKPQILAHIIV